MVRETIEGVAKHHRVSRMEDRTTIVHDILAIASRVQRIRKGQIDGRAARDVLSERLDAMATPELLLVLTLAQQDADAWDRWADGVGEKEANAA